MKFLPAAHLSMSGRSFARKASKSYSKGSADICPRPGGSTAYTCIDEKCSTMPKYVEELVPAAPTMSKFRPNIPLGESRTIRVDLLASWGAVVYDPSRFTKDATVQSSDIRKARSGRSWKAAKTLEHKFKATRELAP